MLAWKCIDWNGVFSGRLVAHKLFMRSAIVRKDLLVRFAPQLLPCSFVVTNFDQVEAIVRDHENTTTKWVLKLADSSNANGLLLLDAASASDMHHVCELMQQQSLQSPQRVRVLQQYVLPQLVQGRKSHLRVLVLVLGDLQVLVYRNVRVLMARKRFEVDNWGDRLVHITNQSVASANGASTSTSQLNWALDEAFDELQHAEIHTQIEQIVRELFDCVRDRKRFFLALPNCLELFGLDLALDATGKLWLLEANPDPNLHVFPAQQRRQVLKTMLSLPVDDKVEETAATDTKCCKKFRPAPHLEDWVLVVDHAK